MFTPLFVGGIGPMELFIVLFLAVLLFGAQKLPELARASGQAMGEFQRGRAEIEAELRQSAEESREATEVTVDADSPGKPA